MAYLSCFEADVQAVVQWGGPLPTMDRCTATLLSDPAFSRLLTPSALGEDEHEYEGFKDRYRTVRNLCLERIPEVLRSDDPDEFGELLCDLPGLFASTTQLYHAAGMDVTVQLRVPDTDQLQRNDYRYESFVDFFGHTVPKQTVYESDVGIHSGYREVLEQRDQKLQSRLDYDVDVDTPNSECIVSWVVSGPDATVFESDIYRAIRSRAAMIHEEVREGEENAPLLKGRHGNDVSSDPGGDRADRRPERVSHRA